MNKLKIEEQPKTFAEKLKELQPGQCLEHAGLSYHKLTADIVIVQQGSAMAAAFIGERDAVAKIEDHIISSKINYVESDVAALFNRVTRLEETLKKRAAEGTGRKPVSKKAAANKGGAK